jgi:hypothetical protein
MFYAVMRTKHFNFNVDAILVFETVIVNEGEHYDPHDRMVVGFTTTYAISTYHYWYCELESRSGRGVQHYVIKFVSDRLVVFSRSSTIKTINKWMVMLHKIVSLLYCQSNMRIMLFLIYGQLNLNIMLFIVYCNANPFIFSGLSGCTWGVQHYVIKFVSDLRQVGGFPWVLRFSPIKMTATI